MIGRSLATSSVIRAGKRPYPAFRQSLRLFSTPSGQRGNSAVRVSDKNGKGLKSSGGFSDSGEVNSIQAAAKEVKKSRLYLVLLGGIGGGAALVYLKPKAIFDILETLPIYYALGFKPRMTDETTIAPVVERSQSKHITTLYNEDPEGKAVQAVATDSETPSTVEEDTQPSFATSEKLSTSSDPEEESPTENELYSTSHQSVPKSSSEDLIEPKPDGDDARRVQEEEATTSLQEGEGAPETGESAVNSAVKDVMQQGTDFRQELEKGMLRDLEELDAPALRYRIAQLVAEMQERTKWESLRWHENMRRIESDTANHYTSLKLPLSQPKENPSG